MNDFVVGSQLLYDNLFLKLGVRTKLSYLYLCSICDANGVLMWKDSFLEEKLMLSQSAGLDFKSLYGEKTALSILKQYNWVCEFWVDNQKYLWIPRFPGSQPNRGALKPKKMGYPFPPDELVKQHLRNTLGREPTRKECKSASPATYGKSGSSTTMHNAAMEVWEEWKNRQVKPGACTFSYNVSKLILDTLKHITKEQAKGLIRFAYEAEHPTARFWRGGNDTGRKYLGLDNLFRKKKLSSRVQMVEEWLLKKQKALGPMQDDFGPMAKYRIGPAGTTTDFAGRPARLNNQQQKMIALFSERGGAGVTTTELAAIALKYSARISELRGLGYDIAIVERNENGVNTYVMVGSPEDSNGLD